MSGSTSSSRGPLADEPLFDRVIIVDWSANSTPKRGKDSIWVAWFDGDDVSGHTRNVSTRAQAADLIEELVFSEATRRTLLGVDFSLGFPAGTAAALGLSGTPWSAMWQLLDDLVVDDARNRNNRFEVAAELNRRIAASAGPFWGCPHLQSIAGLTTTKVSCDPLPEWRACEAELRRVGHRPFSCWQLMGAGSVGSQSLLGIAALHRLRNSHGDGGLDVDVWPFTTGLTVPRSRARSLVIAEVWPSIVPVADAGRIRDEAQVLTLGALLVEADRSGRLARLFAPHVSEPSRSTIVAEEGWVLGAGTAMPL